MTMSPVCHPRGMDLSSHCLHFVLHRHSSIMTNVRAGLLNIPFIWTKQFAMAINNYAFKKTGFVF